MANNKMREALKQVKELNDLWFDTFTLPDCATSIHDEIENVISAALAAPETAEKSSAVGNAAKLREALKLCLRGMCGYCRMDAEARGMTTECVNGCEALLMAKAALAATEKEGGNDENE